jgi:TM2 domain-containing membrane protein YozV
MLLSCQAKEEPKMQCYRCSHDLAPTAKFCAKCGASATETPYTPGASLGLDSANNPPPVEYAPPVQQNISGGDAYFLLINGQQSGPYTIVQVRSMWQSGAINTGTSYWQAGMPQWQYLANIRHFLDMPSGNQYGAPIIVNQVGYQVGYPIQQVVSTKSRVAFILLGLFLGCLGIHNFYAGYTGKGIAQLLITLFLGWLFGLGIFITGIWALIEIIAVSTDAQGLRMS